MEQYIFESNGVIAECNPNMGFKYITRGKCKVCDSFLYVTRPAWENRDFVYKCGPDIGKIVNITSARCPVCGGYFDTKLNPIVDVYPIIKMAY